MSETKFKFSWGRAFGALGWSFGAMHLFATVDWSHFLDAQQFHPAMGGFACLIVAVSLFEDHS